MSQGTNSSTGTESIPSLLVDIRELKGVLEILPDAAVLVDRGGRILWASRHAQALFGYGREDLIGEPVQVLVPERFRERHAEHVASFWAGPRSRPIGTGLALYARRKDGSEFPVDISLAPVKTPAGMTVIVSIRDASERHEAHRNIQERTTYLDTLINSSPFAIVVLDSEHHVHMINPAFERLFSYTLREIVGSRLDDLIVPSGFVMEGIDATRRVLAGETVHLTTRRSRRDGSLIDVEVWGVPLMMDGKVAGVYGLYQDITDRRRLEQEFFQAQKMEAVGRVAAGIAHDFNNLLVAAMGCCDLALERFGADPELHRLLRGIEDAVEEGAAFTRQLLALSRKQVVQPTVLNLNAVLTEARALLEPLLAEGIKLTLELDPRLECIKADRAQIDQVILNLAVNARDAMPTGGRLIIRTSNAELNSSHASRYPFFQQPGEYVLLTVEDTGAGMDEWTSAHLFEPFFTTKGAKGTGLGLATVYSIVKQSNGYIWVDSKPEKGTTFRIYFPRTEEEVTAAESRLAVTPAESRSGVILLVEDNAEAREITRELLSSAGYTVLTAADAVQALVLAKKYSGRIDLLLTDVIMPDLDGRTLAQDLHLMRPQMKVLFISGYTDDVLAQRGILPSHLFFLPKPFNKERLIRKVQEVLSSPASLEP